MSKIFFHNDLDGRCAGAIAYRALKHQDKDSKIELIEVDYKDEIKVKEIQLCEKIIIVDFSFKPEIMEKVLLLTKNIIWIDHHKTAFEYKYSEELEGLRDKAFSGCELTWKYFIPEARIPRAVELIGDRDIWKWEFGQHTANFNMGLKLYSHQPEDKIWDELFPYSAIPLCFGKAGHDTLRKVLEIEKEGVICCQFRDMFCSDYAKSYGFETEFEGYKCFALGLYMFGSEAFGDRMKDYDICLSFAYLGDNWTVGLYSDGKGIDVGKLAQKYGKKYGTSGGGHSGAAGFTAPELPFMKKEKFK